MIAIVKKIQKELMRNADERIRASGQRFFKEKVKMHGIKTSVVGKIARDFFAEVKGLGKNGILGICDRLWRSGTMEESFIACDWSYRLRKEYDEKDFRIFERWVAEFVGNWASCDTLCNHTVGAFLEMYPDHLADLKRWAKSDNRWMRRASAVSLIVPARNGKFLKTVFGIADLLLSDGDDLVQKGAGWMLKAASQAHQKEVLEYVMENRGTMPGTMLRYAIEKMPKELKRKAMER